MSQDPVKRCLIVFVKPPIPGDVKTRLIPHFTGREAADLYKCFATDVLKSVGVLCPSIRLLIAYQPHARAANLSWLGLKSAPEYFKQDGRSLGERLVQAFGVAFGRGARHVVVIGSDAPTLPPCYIQQAFDALQNADVVLGPSKEGGYYLIGLSRPCLRLFDDVTWSSDQVFERTARNAQNQGYRLRVLPAHYDVETIDDVVHLHRQLASRNAQAPVTKKYLDTLLKNKPVFQAAAR